MPTELAVSRQIPLRNGVSRSVMLSMPLYHIHVYWKCGRSHRRHPIRRNSMSTLSIKALDDIGADETAGYSFSLNVLKEHFSQGVQLLADHELHPAIHAGELKMVKRQTSRFVAGTLKSPGYRTSEALTAALLPASDPELRELKPNAFKKVNLRALSQFHATTIRADLTTIVIVGDVSPDEARAVIEKWFGGWKSVGPTPNTVLPRVPLNKASSIHIPDPGATQDSVIRRTVGPQPLRSRLLSTTAGQYHFGRRFRGDSSLS
jgi:hypothetical protein